MILRITLSAEDNIRLPKSYNHYLQAFFYKNMDPILSNFLHNIGFVYNKRRFKLFTFSKIIGKIIKKEGDFIDFDNNITVYFASPLIDIVSSSVKNLIKNDGLFLANNKLYLNSIDVIKPEINQEDIIVRCLSPITVYTTPVGQKRFQYLNPWDEKFYQIIKDNLLKKYEIVYNKSYKGKVAVEPVKICQKYKKKIVYRKTLIEAWEGYYRIKGSKEILKLALEAGLGAKNPQGFGMVEVVKDVESY
ncbi:MAG: CRISPR-associated endoribonuclease Cas6 [Aquificaceae bacterium]